jgi:hypothetical protein
MSYSNQPPKGANKQMKGPPRALLLLSFAAVQIPLSALPLLGVDGTASADLLGRIDRDWRGRREAAHLVYYKVTGTRIHPKGFLNEGPPSPSGESHPATDHESPLEANWLIDFDNNRFRTEINTEIYYEDRRHFRPRWRAIVFNGREVKSDEIGVTNHRDEFGPTQPNFRILKEAYPVFEMFDWPVFLVNGVRPGAPDFSVRNLKRSLNASEFTIAGIAQFEGRECQVLRSRPSEQSPGDVDELWIDVARGSLIVKWQRQFKGTVIHECRMTYLEENGTWSLAGWQDSATRGRLMQANTVRVVERRTDAFPNTVRDQFDLKPAANAIVLDEVALAAYQVAEDGKSTVPIGGDTPAKPAWQSSGVLAGLFCAVGVLLLFARSLRRLAKKRE